MHEKVSSKKKPHKEDGKAGRQLGAVLSLPEVKGAEGWFLMHYSSCVSGLPWPSGNFLNAPPPSATQTGHLAEIPFCVSLFFSNCTGCTNWTNMKLIITATFIQQFV